MPDGTNVTDISRYRAAKEPGHQPEAMAAAVAGSPAPVHRVARRSASMYIPNLPIPRLSPRLPEPVVLGVPLTEDWPATLTHTDSECRGWWERIIAFEAE